MVGVTELDLVEDGEVPTEEVDVGETETVEV